MAYEIRFTETYGEADRGRYIRLGFEVPDNIDRIEIEYDYPRYGEFPRADGTEKVQLNAVDLGLVDGEGKFRGWSGSERRSAAVSAYEATPGYRIGPIMKGSWSVSLGLYRISEKVRVDVRVRLVPKERVLLAGDMHMHTNNSDGAYATAAVIDRCRAAGLDFIALTDHNNTRQNTEIGRADGIVVIPGMEFTNYRGHANFYFSGDTVDFAGDPLSNTREEMASAFAEARKSGAVISLNHIACDDCPWEFGFEDLSYDLMEVWNGPMKPAEIRAVAIWHAALAGGKRIAAVGGSDMHRDEPHRMYGSPTTFVYAESRSRRDILAGILAGRSFLSESKSGPRPELRIGNAGLGDTVRLSPGGGHEVEVLVASVRPGDIVRVLDGSGESRKPHVTQEWAVDFSGDFKAAFPAKRVGFYRAEIWRELLPGVPLLVALCNPIFIG
ncbi:MAG: CehA/McbA family metallohydrolase [Rectinema sp.]